MSFLALSGLINFLACLSVGSFVLLKNPYSEKNRSYFYLNSSVALYSFGYFLWQLSGDAVSALFWFKILTIGIILINVTFLHFVFAFIGVFQKRKIELFFYYLLCLIFIILNISLLLYTGVEKRHDLGFWPTPTSLFNVYLIFWFYLCFYGFGWLIRGMHITTGTPKEQIKYFTLAAILGFAGGATNWPMWYKIYFPPNFNILVAVYILTVSYAIVRYRLMNIRIAITRTSIFLIVFAFVMWVPFYVGYETKSWVLSALFMAIFASGGPMIHRLLQLKAENILMAQQKRYQKALLNAGKGMVREHDLNKLMRLIVRVVKVTVKIEFVGAFLKDREKGCFRLVTVRGLSGLPDFFTLPLDHPLARVIEEKQDPVSYEEINPSIDDAFVKSIHLVVPSFGSDGELLAFLVLGEKADQSVYTQDDIDVFRILSHQASLAVENCMFVEETKESQRRLFQAEKLASIGGMADGVAHQIKNRLNHFSIASGEAQYEIQDFVKAHPEMVEQSPDLKKTFDYLAKIAQSLIENVKRTNSVIQGILNYARVEEKDTFFSTFAFSDILNLSLELLRVKHEIAVFPLTVEVDPNFEMYGVKAQIMEAVYNILDNCYEAVQEKFKYHLSPEDQDKFQYDIHLKITQEPAKVIIEIHDNGIGIKEEDYHKIFAPFFTTKSSYKSGSGIGMYVVKRMVEENHKGKVTFQSEYMKGTYFRIELPKKAS
jgi:signal transduction histidine kinase